MAMKIKVHGGTVQGDSHLCTSCMYGSIRTEGNRTIARCSQFGIIRRAVTKCSEFALPEDHRLGQMKENAWYLYRGENNELKFISPLEREQAGNPFAVVRSRRRNASNPAPPAPVVQ